MTIVSASDNTPGLSPQLKNYDVTALHALMQSKNPGIVLANLLEDTIDKLCTSDENPETFNQIIIDLRKDLAAATLHAKRIYSPKRKSSSPQRGLQNTFSTMPYIHLTNVLHGYQSHLRTPHNNHAKAFHILVMNLNTNVATIAQSMQNRLPITHTND